MNSNCITHLDNSMYPNMILLGLPNTVAIWLRSLVLKELRTSLLKSKAKSKFDLHRD